MITGFDYERAHKDLRSKLVREVNDLCDIILETARQNIRYYPAVREHLKRRLFVLSEDHITGTVTADYWQAWLEQFGKGSLMAGVSENPGLTRYMNSEAWNSLRSRSKRVVVGRAPGRYKSIDGKTKISGGGYAGVDLEALAARGDIDPKFGPTPPTYFLRIALLSNKNRIMQGIQNVIKTFPYHNYFKVVKE